jgi:hypothetical protein
MLINKKWNEILKKTIKLYPNKSIKNILLKSKKQFNNYKKFTIKRNKLLYKKI